MTTATEVLERARLAFADRAWVDAHRQLQEADERGLLEPGDLESLAVVSDLVGHYEASARTWERAHDAHLARGQIPPAARCAFWAGHLLILRGEGARGSGWMARAARLLDEHALEGPERGLVIMWEAKRRIIEGHPQAALATIRRANELAIETQDPDLRAFTWLVHGQALVQLGEAAAGLRLLDEAFLEVQQGRVSPIATGIVYCAVILTCQDVFDVARATEWTAALHDWCEQQPDLVPFRGQCLIHRSELMQLHGEWAEAFEEAERACRAVRRGKGDPTLGLALYQLGELHRARGQVEQAEAAYAEASRWGYDPQPGLALLRLSQGRTEAAAAAIRRAVDEAGDRVDRCKLLAAHVEIMVGVGDLDAADATAVELAGVAADVDAPLPTAMAAQARGRVALAAGDAGTAIVALRDAGAAWRSLQAPYGEARARELIAAACRQVGDEDTATLELAAARRAYEGLGAVPDLARVEAPARPPKPGGLTEREVEVLRLVADGATNRAIADELFISEKTVERHLSNVFPKLGVSNRAAATAWAYEHDLV